MTDESVRYATNGKANAALTLGIIGTALGAFGNGNLFGGTGIFGGNQATNNEIGDLKMEIAELKSSKYTDAVGIDLYKAIIEKSNEEDQKIKDLSAQVTSYVIDLDKRVALNEQAMILNRQYDQLARDASFQLLEQKLNCCCDKANAKIDYNAQLAALSDASMLSYVQATYIPGTLKLPITSICPQPATAN